MNTLINRLFTKDEPDVVIDETTTDKRRSLLLFLIAQGSSTAQLEALYKRVQEFEFHENKFKAEFEFIQFYLELERYLIYNDPRYISSETKLRALIRKEFPELTQIQAFLPLYESETNQEIALARVFITYVVKAFELEAKSKRIASAWLGTLNFTPLANQLSLIERINTFRSLKDKSNEMYIDFSNSFGSEWVDSIFLNCHKEFTSIYSSVKAVKAIKEMVPVSMPSSPIVSTENVIKLNEINGHLKTNRTQDTDKSAILENLLDSFILFNRKAKILDHNSNAPNIFGLQEEELKSKSLLKLLPDKLSEQLKKDLDNLDQGIPNVIIGTRQEIEIQNAEGGYNDFEIAITNNYTENEDTYSIFFKNITNRKDTLKTISEAKLNAERMALAKSTFLSNMSHEIRTPLNVILGLSEIITKNDLSNEELLRKNLDGIDFSARNLLSIVNDILDFSKIEAGKLTVQAIDFNLREVIESLANGFEIKAKEKGLNLFAKMDDTIPDVVIGDQYRLNQILTNLIGNAIKFTQSGEITIHITEVSQDENDIEINFEVKDTGIGIADDKLKSIFDSFYQVENPENSKIMGTGLGLAITKELIYLQKGTLKAKSEVGNGSVFEFSLPFKKSKLIKISNVVKNVERRDEKLKDLRVLVAEDNKMNQFYIKQLLSNMNVQVDIAENGQEAVEVFQNSKIHYDLILMDMHMPIMNGVEAISIIRQANKDAIRKVPIVACSADVFPEARKNAIKAGIDFYLTKPLNEEAVKEVLFWLISDDELLPSMEAENNGATTTDLDVTRKSIDINLLNETFDNDEEFIISLLEVFIQITPEDYKSLRNCIEREFYSRASNLAHKMKSSFMNLGMTTHGHHLQQIESNIITKEGLQEAKRHFASFSNLYTKALLEVNILLIELKQH